MSVTCLGYQLSLGGFFIDCLSVCKYKHFFSDIQEKSKKMQKNLWARCIFANLFFLANICVFFLGVTDRKYYLCERN